MLVIISVKLKVRPCLLYEEEYKDCKSIRSRFHQYFIYGSLSDCTQWKRDYDNCIRWRENNNKNACRELIEVEMSRRIERLKAHRENDVWEKRASPPKSWNKPLPPYMQERMKGSYLAQKADELESPSKERTFCAIM
ncbi:hypothetical protein O3M35_000663 [Rhynocoris fuscipes]|uniref:Synaptic plasticity regulator PANTS n=1 Tax=Rhynocoris fuscipes TaxID=488301 RepID=A0AAW1DS13_9HEMI